MGAPRARDPLTILVLVGMLVGSFAVEIVLLLARRPKVDLGEQFRPRGSRA